MSQGHLLAYTSKTSLKYTKQEEKVNLTVSALKSKKGRTQGALIYYQSRNLQGLINYLRSLV